MIWQDERNVAHQSWCSLVDRCEQYHMLLLCYSVDEQPWGNVTWTDTEVGELEGIERTKGTQVSQTGGLSRL
jgi:hypothetical protein